MRVLAVESSTETLSVAAGDASGIVASSVHVGQGHSERALPAIEAVLRERGWSLADVDAIAFAAGPGSFTGVRIACGIAQGLALGAGKPVVPVGTLEALAEAAFRRHGATRVLACLDARMHEVYAGAFVRDDGGWREVVAPWVGRQDDLEVPDGRWFGAGNGLRVAPALAADARLEATDDALMPDAHAVVVLAHAKLARGAGVPPAQALPLYVRHRVALTAAERAAGAKL
jgi:tRNA threonylcarbamoyladenosine biosynthesis protein TsaB